MRQNLFKVLLVHISLENDISRARALRTIDFTLNFYHKICELQRLYWWTKIFETNTETFFETKSFETNTETFFETKIFEIDTETKFFETDTDTRKKMRKVSIEKSRDEISISLSADSERSLTIQVQMT